MKQIKKFDTFVNEGIRQYLKPKSKEEVLKKVMEQPKWYRREFIEMNDIESIFIEDELKNFEKDALYIDYSDLKLYYAETNNARYHLIKDDEIYIFDENWDKLKEESEDYNNIKDAFEYYLLKMNE